MDTADGPRFESTTSTWDDWVAVRPRPEPPPGEGPQGVAISSGDFVAAALMYDQTDLLDFVQQSTRDGLRQLFDEFERDTAGQTMTWGTRDRLRKDLTFEEIEVSKTDADEVLLTIAGGDGRTYALPIDPTKAADLAAHLLRFALACGFDPDAD